MLNIFRIYLQYICDVFVLFQWYFCGRFVICNFFGGYFYGLFFCLVLGVFYDLEKNVFWYLFGFLGEYFLGILVLLLICFGKFFLGIFLVFQSIIREFLGYFWGIQCVFGKYFEGIQGAFWKHFWVTRNADINFMEASKCFFCCCKIRPYNT